LIPRTSGGELRSARPTSARAPLLGGISPAREERRHEPALRGGLDGERGQRQCDRESDVIILGTERRRAAKRGMRFVHPHRRVLEAAELRVVGPVAEPDRESGMDRPPGAGRCGQKRRRRQLRLGRGNARRRCLGVRGFASRLRARRPGRERPVRRKRHATRDAADPRAPIAWTREDTLAEMKKGRRRTPSGLSQLPLLGSTRPAACGRRRAQPGERSEAAQRPKLN